MQVITVKYIFFAILVLVILLFASYKILIESKYADNRLLKGYLSTLEWSARIIPPLLLLPLFKVPFEVFTSLIWLVCGIATIQSLYNLFKKWDMKSKIRPALTVIIFFSAATYMFNHTVSVRKEIDNIARAAASNVQTTCKSEGVCPESPQGWQKDRSDRVCTRVEFMRACYIRPEDNLKFLIRVRHSIDDTLLIQGGVNDELQEERLLDIN